MSKKRKRHENADELTNTNEMSAPMSEMVSPETEEAVHEKVLTPEEVELVQKKVFYALKEMGRTFKKARDFEVRKIIKRIKAAKQANDSEKAMRLEKELLIAKSLDVHPFSDSYVYKRLESDPLCLQNPQLLADHAPSSLELSPEDEAITKNLVGRLNLSAVVKADMTTNMNKIHRAAGFDVPIDHPSPNSKRSKPPPKTQKQPETSPASTSPTHKSISPTPFHDFTRSDAPVPESDAEQSEEEEDDDDDDEEEEDEALSISPRPTKKKALLPALSTGYIPASDSDSDPDEEYKSFGPLKKIRKNKRGQRARQAIWEKKYGRAARHLNPNPPQAKELPRSKKPRERSGEDKSHDKIPSSVEVIEKVVKKVNDPHPSWVAKQRLREQQKAMATAIKPQKILFD